MVDLITVTPTAKAYFKTLIDAQSKMIKVKKLNLRLKAINPGTANADLELSYCEEQKQRSSDLAIDCVDFILYIDLNSKLALKEATIDYIFEEGYKEKSFTNGKIHIKAPFLKTNFISQNQITNSGAVVRTDLWEKIDTFLLQEVNPFLAKHNGAVQLRCINTIDLGLEVILEFNGGCKGCSMIGLTLKNGVEKLLKTTFPEIVAVIDATDHNVI